MAGAICIHTPNFLDKNGFKVMISGWYTSGLE